MSFIKFTHLVTAMGLVGFTYTETNAAAILRQLTQTPERKVASYLTEVASKSFTGSMQIQQAMSKHYQHMRLLSHEGKWVDSSLQNLTSKLLPDNVTVQDIQSFIDEIADQVEKNPYLHDVLTTLKSGENSAAVSHFREGVKESLPDILTYAMTLENLTKAMAENPSLIQTVYDQFQVHKQEVASVGIAQKIKYYSVEAAIKGILEAHSNQAVAGDFSSFLLPLNIAEASVLEGIGYGQWGNARAGWSLIKNGPADTVDPKTGAAPATFTTDRTQIELHMPLTEKWDDLYSAWNMGFVSNLNSAPYHMSKLLIPKVGSYHENPGIYMYNRVLALFLHVNYLAFRENDDPEFVDKDLAGSEVAKVFNQVNRQNAYDYEAKLKKGL